jgi:UDP-N-acetylglucosamine--N-acetylmuramyl-(pentapeptide) pyrophosphoryl-undecaprenol N-acetylglucosamine transferase
MSKRLIIAGGGTGGHIFPAIAIAQSFQQLLPDVVILFVGAKGKMEMEKVPQAGYKIEGLDIVGFNRTAIWKNISLPFKLLKSMFKARRIVKTFKPDAVIGVGGYSTYPVLKAAQSLGIPTFIHEANSFAGKSNILLAKRARKVFTGTSGMERFFPAEKIVVTGNPVRKLVYAEQIDPLTARASFGLKENLLTVLVVGGSLGAKSINEAIAAGIDKIRKEDVQLIWQTGKNFIDLAKQAGHTHSGVWIQAFIQEMGKAYAAADLIVSRAGAMSVAEIALVGKPVIFVPYPFAAEDHQTANANHLVKGHAAMMIPDKEAATQLVNQVLVLAKDEEKKKLLIKNIQSFAIADADQRVADEIISVIGK